MLAWPADQGEAGEPLDELAHLGIGQHALQKGGEGRGQSRPVEAVERVVAGPRNPCQMVAGIVRPKLARS